jgi:hypothetical protein
VKNKAGLNGGKISKIAVGQIRGSDLFLPVRWGLFFVTGRNSEFLINLTRPKIKTHACHQFHHQVGQF